MALTFLSSALSDAPPVGPKVIFDLKTRKKLVGHTIVASGDGLSAFSASGDVITHSGDGPGGMNNQGAWFVEQAPTGGRQSCFQIGHVNGVLWWQYSKSAGFVGGSPSASTCPTATDAKNVLGTGPGFSGATYVTGGISAIRYSILVDDAAPWGWLVMANPSAGAGQSSPYWMQMLLACDPVMALPGDDDPYMFLAAYGADQVGSPVYHGINNTQSAFVKHATLDGSYGAWGYNNGAWQSIPWRPPAAYPSHQAPNTLGVNPYSGNDMLIAVPYMASSPPLSNGGYKGLSTLLHFTSANRTMADRYQLEAEGDYRDIGGMAISWDGSVAVL